MNEWNIYKVEAPYEDEDIQNSGRSELQTVSHVTHVHTALQIVESGMIKPQLVYDESKLNQKRILVNWLSPNIWSDGSRYGNIAFKYKWAKVIQNKKFYWVEAMTDYNPAACRILITESCYDGLEKYDPESGEGPWLWDRESDIHYWNGKYCIEIMLEQELSIDECCEIDFVRHHDSLCCISNSTCQDLGDHEKEGGLRFISGAIGRNLDYSCLRKIKVEEFEQSLLRHYHDLKNFEAKGSIEGEHPSVNFLIESYLLGYLNKDSEKCRKLVSLFCSAEEFAEKFYAYIASKGYEFQIEEVCRNHRQLHPNSCSVSALEFVAKAYNLIPLDSFPLQSKLENQGKGFAEPDLQNEVGLFATSDKDDYDVKAALALFSSEIKNERFPIVALRAFGPNGSPSAYHINVVASKDGELILIEPADGTIRASTTEELKRELEQSCAPDVRWPRNTIHILTVIAGDKNGQ